MKTFDFSLWPERLAQAALPERSKTSFAITIRWYLSFCRRGRADVTVQSARDFIAFVPSSDFIMGKGSAFHRKTGCESGSCQSCGSPGRWT